MDERELERRFDEMRDNIRFHKQGVSKLLLFGPLLLALLGVVLASEGFGVGSLLLPNPNVVVGYGFGALMLGLAAVYVIHYRRRRSQVSQRLRGMADGAVPVDCTVGETHVFEIAYGYYGSVRRYYPAVAFEYERDGTTHRSVQPYPDGISSGSGNLQDAERMATEIADRADGTAYYDPATDQAFLVADPQTDALNQWNGELALLWFATGLLTLGALVFMF